MKRLLQAELGFLPEGPGLDKLLEQAEWLSLPSRHVLIPRGEIVPDVFIVREGIIRFFDWDGNKERTFVFGLPGTIAQSRFSFVMHQPSYYQVETCCHSTILRIPEELFWNIVKTDHQLCLWMLKYTYTELYLEEVKYSTTHKGSAKSRFKAMMKKRPMILEKVPQKVIASYLGITPEYFSMLKHELSKEEGLASTL